MSPRDVPVTSAGSVVAAQIGHTPAPKATRFEPLWSIRGDRQDSFIEEYANDVTDPDDPTLQVNTYVLLK